MVGAGPSGLVTAKELLQEGHDVTCFERTADLGGVFRFRDVPGSVGVWETCRLTSSILVTSFSDYFPGWQRGAPFEHRHPTHREYVDYLADYARHFGVLERIRFGCEVVDVAPEPGSRWRVTCRSTPWAGGRARGAPADLETRRFDAVAICSGLHREPHVPPIPGLETFRGQVLHAAHYKRPASISGRSAVFVGVGESGSDIVGEASAFLGRSYLSLRRGPFIVPRMLRGRPNDYTGTRLLYSLPDFVSRRSDDEAAALRRRAGRWLAPLRALPLATGRARAWLHERGARPDPRQAAIERLVLELRATSGGTQFETFATKTEGLAEAVVDGRLELRPEILQVTGSGVRFVDGTTAWVDAIVLCTGFEPPSVPFLRADVDLQSLYKRCLDPSWRETLAFVGFVRPSLGAIPPLSEMQARWYARVLSGRASLPSSERMATEARADLEARRAYHARVFDRMPYLVDFAAYLDELAEQVGCKPRLSELLRHPTLLYKVHTSAFSGVQYRLRGPHAAPRLAAAILRHAPSHARGVRFLDLALAEVASALGSRRYRPHLTLRTAPRRASAPAPPP